jgi:xanthine dehydrogenase accessory factor
VRARPRSLVLVRGAGDIATGVIARLRSAGFPVAALEVGRPTAIRRRVALSECMYEGEAEVEGVRARRVDGIAELLELVSHNVVPVLEDPDCTSLRGLRPMALVDAILAKRNLGTRLDMARIVLALGPGFEAGTDAHAVIETNRGHDLGRVILSGRAEADTGSPGIIGGFGLERVVRAPIGGLVVGLRGIGDLVEAGEPILEVAGEGGRVLVLSPLAGVLRGIIRSGSRVGAGLKIADVDPRGNRESCSTISDKARAIGGGVLEAIMRFGGRP